jgi:hypothetical protein
MSEVLAFIVGITSIVWIPALGFYMYFRYDSYLDNRERRYEENFRDNQ